MKNIIIIFFLICSTFLSCSPSENDLEFSSGRLRISINKKGAITGFIDKTDGMNYLQRSNPVPLMSIRIKGEFLTPVSSKLEEEKNILSFTYRGNLTAGIKIESKETHLTFELLSITGSEDVELIVWGPYPTTIDKIIGETVGVVQGDQFALGIQSLNPKTLGGYPWNENDCLPQIDIFEQDDYSDLREESKRQVLYRVEAAKPDESGSSLQAYCRNRNKTRIIENWGHDKYTAPLFNDGGVIGSKIALFGCPVDKTLQAIGAIETAEGLPHPMIDGIWSKISPLASSAYLILDFSESDIGRALEITEKSGLKYLYHSDPFETWGNFLLKKEYFPDGIQSLKQCVQQAEEKGIKIGVHTLSNFITPNDPWVTPVPDKRLAKVGSSIVSADIDDRTKTIPVESPDFFNQYKNNHLRTVVIEDELVRYGSVSEDPPWQLLDCQRAAFRTRASSHRKGTEIAKLADHAYKVFLTNAELSIEMSKNISDLFNRTGLRQISFDGLEGNRSTGMGNYGEVLFTKTWYDNLDDHIKSHYIADASRTSHFFWHIYTRMNWGEPWYAGFRESQTEYRLKNQPYFKRNLMPAMLGWFRMTPETSIEDIEWMLARSAAFNAGYAFVTSFESIEANGHSDKILELLGEWEGARMAGAFSTAQKKLMEDISREFHLETVNNQSWDLFQIHTFKFRHEKKVKQPGEPLYSDFEFENPVETQPIGFILTAANGGLSNITMEMDRHKEIQLPFHLENGETAQYIGDNLVVLYNKNRRKIREIIVDRTQFAVSTGKHSLRFDCQFSGSDKPMAKLEIRLTGQAERLTGK